VILKEQDNRAPITIRRILVALDASPHSLAALDAAIELAARFKAELLGLYVEDRNVLRLAELPFTRELDFLSARTRHMRMREIERQLRVQMQRVRDIFSGITRRAHVRATFHVARGAVISEVVSAASDADVLILGKIGRSLTSARRLGSTTRTVLAEGPALTLILQDGVRLEMPVCVAYDGSPLARKALRVAVTLLSQKREPLIVFLVADATFEKTASRRASQLHAQVDALIQERVNRGWEDVVVDYRVLSASSVSSLIHSIQAEHVGVLVLPSRISVFDSQSDDGFLPKLLEALDIPVLLVR
jgi:nucleotide-binding universal stress UspA family protein